MSNFGSHLDGKCSCSSPNIVRVIKSRRMRWAGYVARMDEETWGV